MFAHSLPPGAKLAAYLAAKAMNPHAANSIADPATRKRGSRLATYIAQQEMLGRRIPIYTEDSTGIPAGSAPADELHAPTAADLIASLSGDELALQGSGMRAKDGTVLTNRSVPYSLPAVNPYTDQRELASRRSLARALGAPVDLVSMATNPFLEGSDYLFGTNFGAAENPPLLSSRHIEEVLTIPGRPKPLFEGKSNKVSRAFERLSNVTLPRTETTNSLNEFFDEMAESSYTPAGDTPVDRIIRGGARAAEFLTDPDAFSRVAEPVARTVGGVGRYIAENPRQAIFVDPFEAPVRAVRGFDDASYYLATGQPGMAGQSAAEGAEAALETALTFYGGRGLAGPGGARPSIPTSRQLRNIADDRYLEAQAEGVKASRAQAARMAEDMRTIATRKGMLPPTGSLDAAPENVQRVIKTMNAYARGPMTPDNIRAARNTLEYVLENASGKEREAVRSMLSAFDEFTGMVSPGLREANAKLDRAARLKKLEDRRAVAEANTGKHKHPQYDEALREEYRKIFGNNIDNQLDEFTDEELAAILKVIHGTRMSRIARTASSAAPTDLPGALKTFVPAIAGALSGQPGVGISTGSVIAGGGFLGRKAANRFAKRYADEARALTATGVPLDPIVLMTPEQKKAAAALLSAQTIANADKVNDR